MLQRPEHHTGFQVGRTSQHKAIQDSDGDREFHLRMLGRNAYSAYDPKIPEAQKCGVQVFGIQSSAQGAFTQERLTVLYTATPEGTGVVMNAGIRSIVDALEPMGVFDLATLLDPATITNVAIDLASCRDPNEYAVWLKIFSESYGVSTSALATDVLIVLSYCSDHVGAVIANAAGNEVRQLVVA
jgi:hypothetical protein